MATPLSRSLDKRESEKKSKKALFAGIALAAFGLGSVGSVFAANVQINSGTGISFTQGAQVIAACDTDGIGTNLDATYDGTAFSLSQIVLTGIADACDGKTLTLSLYEVSDVQVTVTAVLDHNDGGNDGTFSITNTATDAIVAYSSGDPASDANVWVGIDTSQNVSVVYETDESASTVAANGDDLVIEIN